MSIMSFSALDLDNELRTPALPFGATDDTPAAEREPLLLPLDTLIPSPFSLSVYGDTGEPSDLIESLQTHGLLVPLVVAPWEGDESDPRTQPIPGPARFEILSGHRRFAAAQALHWTALPCVLRELPSAADRQRAILEYNRYRRKSFSQLMREADALETLLSSQAADRKHRNLRQFQENPPDRRKPDDRHSQATGRTDETIARALELGGKDLYRQARAVWRAAGEQDPRALSAVGQLDTGTKTIHAAFKDLRRRDRFTTGFQPTPYDVWNVRHDRAFGIPHPGDIPAPILAHLLHYYTAPGALIVDPMAGGGTTIDVCASMGRRCLAYDLYPVRPEIQAHNVQSGFPSESWGCDLVFCDPPYHTMLANRYGPGGAADSPLSGWLEFLASLARHAFDALRPGGFIALLLANQTEKDLPAGFGYLDHVVFGYQILTTVGFLPERRVSCPMSGSYLPQQVRRARAEGRMLGQVRDLLIMRRPSPASIHSPTFPLSSQPANHAPGHSPSGNPPLASS